MNEFKSKTIQYCNNFQERKCRFGDKCRYEHKINPDYKNKEVEYDEKEKSNYICHERGIKLTAYASPEVE